jgi:hypothetical protein
MTRSAISLAPAPLVYDKAKQLLLYFLNPLLNKFTRWCDPQCHTKAHGIATLNKHRLDKCIGEVGVTQVMQRSLLSPNDIMVLLTVMTVRYNQYTNDSQIYIPMLEFWMFLSTCLLGNSTRSRNI